MGAMISSVFAGLLGGGADNVAGANGNGGTNSANSAGGNDVVDEAINMQTERQTEERKKADKKPGQAAAEIANELGISGGGFLMKFAMLLGEALDKKSDELMKVAESINQQTSEFAKLTDQVEGDENAAADRQNKITEGNSRLQTLSAIMNGLSKEMDTLQTVLKTSLDSIGQSQKALASRQ